MSPFNMLHAESEMITIPMHHTGYKSSGAGSQEINSLHPDLVVDSAWMDSG
jgi:hypothetical protein